MRAFIFSLDAFVAFSLALIAIYSLIFFSTIPSSYYYLLTQGHYLTKDVLMTLSVTPCSDSYNCEGEADTLLDYLVTVDDPSIRSNMIENTVGTMVPRQFGYIVEISRDGSWETVYHTPREITRLSVSSQVPSFGYSEPLTKPAGSIYRYNTCPQVGDPELATLITCGEAGEDSNPSKNAPGAALVPSSEVTIVRFTIYI